MACFWVELAGPALLLPALKQAGFTEKFSLGLVTTSGSLGLLLVPSVPLILYGVIAQQIDVGESFTIVELFVAGVVPLCVMLSLLIGWTLWQHRGGVIPRIPFTTENLREALWAARWELPLPFVVLGGVFGGYFAISEAAAVTAAYVVLAEVVLYKEVAWRQLSKVAVESMVMVGGILMILGIALAFTNFLVDAEVPQRLLVFINGYIEDPLSFLILLNMLLLILGAMLDIFSALVIMVPLLLPVAVGYGIHPVHLGIIFLANMQIGYFTPPVGMNLFIASYRFKKPLTELYSATLPFLLVLLLARLMRPSRQVTAHWHCFLDSSFGLNGCLFRAYQWLALRVVSKLMAVITTSPLLANELERCGCTHRRVFVLPCCLSQQQEQLGLALPLPEIRANQPLRVLL